MTIQQVLQALDGRPDLFAVRPTGKIISVTPGNKIIQHGQGKKPFNMVVTRGDLMTDDWQVKTVDQLAKEAETAIAAAAVNE